MTVNDIKKTQFLPVEKQHSRDREWVTKVKVITQTPTGKSHAGKRNTTNERGVDVKNLSGLIRLSEEQRAKQDLISEVRFGDAVYPLQHGGINVRYEFRSDNLWHFWAEVFSPPLYGKGNTLQDAQEDWKYRFHVTFQELYTKCDFERSEEEIKLWLIFKDVVDISAYHAKRQFSLREAGRISEDSRSDQSVRTIEWVDNRKEIIHCQDAPPEFAVVKPGQHFEAEVLRSSTGQLLRILAIRLVNYHEYTENEITKFLDALSSSKDLPVSTIRK